KDDRGADCRPERSRQAGTPGRSSSEGFPGELARSPSRACHEKPPLFAAPASRSSRCHRCSHRRDRPGGGGRHCALSYRHRTSKRRPGRAQTILSEIGIDMSRFPSSGHLISWACICPCSDESAGKRRSTRIRKGSPWLKSTLVQCAWAATRTKGSYLQAQFYRIRARRGPKKAILAVAASILTAIYHMLKDGTLYQDLG